MIISYKKKTIIIVLTIVITVSLFLFFVTIPLINTILNDSRALASEKQKIENLSKEVAEIEDSEIFFSTQQESINRIEKIFINPREPIEFIKSLEESARLSGTTIDVIPLSLSVSKTERASTNQSMGFQLIIDGYATDCFKFLKYLENNSYLISIKSINIIRADQGSVVNSLPGESDYLIFRVKATIVISVLINNH